MSLPKGYKRLEYIQSTGTQYIDSLFAPNQNTRVEIKASCNSGNFFMATPSGNNRYGLYVLTSGRVDVGFGASGYLSSKLTGLSFPATISLQNGSVTGNGNTATFTTQSSFQTTSNLPLFAEGTSASYGEVYWCKVYDNGTLVRDFIPCQNADGEIGLWDEVNSVFYGNAGTGTFTAGPVVPETVNESEITELEYIQSSGVQYVDTLFKPNQDTRAVIDGYNDSASSGWTYGTWESATVNQFAGSCNKSYAVRYGTTNATLTENIPVGPVNFDQNKNAYNVNGTIGSLTAQTFSCQYSIFLFAINAAGAVSSGKFTGKIYSCQIYDNGLLERDYIPAMLANGEVGLYDRVFHEFYRNAGTGEFIAGPEMVHEDYVELEYVEFTGAQYPQGITLPQNFKFDVTLAAGTPGAYANIYDNPSSPMLWIDAGKVLEMNTVKSGYTLTDEKVNIVSDATGTTNELLVDGVVVQTLTKISGASFSVTLFNRGGSQFFYGKVFALSVSDAAVVIIKFIPMLHPSGVAGLWDSVNERFYASATTTDFIAGPEAQTVPKAPAGFRVESETDTLVTLAWDAREDALGYRLYRAGKLLAETTELSLSVAVEPFAGAVFQLTAYNENGEGPAAELTYYSIPENPLLYLITDRTQQDVTERNPKGYYAASDLNRVGYAVEYLAEIIRGYGYTVEVSVKTDWGDTDWKLTGEMVKYLQSLNNLKAIFSTLVELPESMEKIDHEDANNIELLLLTIDETITRVVAGFTRSNAFALYSGQRSLPVSQSDRGRNWGQLDAMNTSWANWQLATWYLLLYGNLKAEGVVE